MERKIPLYLITGFLGSGKTTFIHHVIEHLNGKLKIAVVQNEFAPANFDGKELKRTLSAEFDLLEVNNGSVFCVCLLSGFIESLYTFANQYKPDLILMEASGLSDPVSVGQIFNSPRLREIVFLAGTICIADANNLHKFDKLLPRIQHQLQIADVILINKSDLVSNIGNISDIINNINPFAQKITTQYCRLNPDFLFKTPNKGSGKIFFVPGNSDRPDIQSVVFKSSKPLDLLKIEDFVKQMAQISLRMKGYILVNNHTCLSVHTISDEIHCREISSSFKQTELIMMGYEMDISRIKNLYEHYQ